MTFEITTLGTGSAIPAWGRYLAAHLVNLQHRFFLVDCGEGTQFQLAKVKAPIQKIERVFISHLHGDHFFGLVGVLSSMHLLGRKKPLHIHGPKGLAEILTAHFHWAATFPSFQLSFHELPAVPSVIVDDPQFTVSTIPLHHRIASTGFLFKERFHKRKILADRLPPGLPPALIKALTAGQDIEFGGKRYTCQTLTAPPKPTRSYAYCSDTAYHPETAQWVQGVDLLYHEATFMEEHAARATKTGHSTAKQAAQVALQAGAKQLLLGHFSSRYPDLSPLLHEAKTIFPATLLATERQIFAVPTTEQS